MRNLPKYVFPSLDCPFLMPKYFKNHLVDALILMSRYFKNAAKLLDEISLSKLRTILVMVVGGMERGGGGHSSDKFQDMGTFLDSF